MKRVTILHGSNDRYGASRVLLQDAEIVANLGFHVRVVLPYDGPLTALLRAVGAEVIIATLKVFRRVNPRSAVKLPTNMPCSLRHKEPVVLWTMALFSYLPLLRLRGVPMTLSVHEILPGPTGSLLARFASRSPGITMANSRATARWLNHHGCDRVRTAYPVAPQYAPLPLLSLDEEFRILLAGRLSGAKGHLEAVDVVEDVRKTGTPVNLTLAGSPFPGQESHLRELENRIRDLDWVRYVGELDDLRAALREHHLVLSASMRPESFGLTALEAWAAGRRIVAPDEGGMAEAARLVDGVLYRARDRDSMAEAIRLVINAQRLRQAPAADAPVAQLCVVDRRERVWTEIIDAYYA